jgi:two-component system response regulator EvgA
LRVLLADDHSIVRRGLRSLLEEAGHSVVAEAADGLEAVQLVEEHQPDLLILDIGMPKLNGIEVAARTQKLARPAGVIILSMHADASYILRALAAGHARTCSRAQPTKTSSRQFVPWHRGNRSSVPS